MDLFHRAKVVRLRSHHDKYLVADDDEEGVCQEKGGSSRAARWSVEIVDSSPNFLRLKSCFGRYLTASNAPFLLGVSGRKVLQTIPRRLDSSVEWEPVREGIQVKLKTRYGNFLRANSGLPPLRNSVTHDIPHRTATQDWVLWDVDVIELRPPPVDHGISSRIPPSPDRNGGGSVSSSSSGLLSKQESLESLTDVPPKPDGRMIRYYVADDRGDVDENVENNSFIFNGLNVEDLAERLKEETRLDDVILCTKSPLNGKLYPLRLQLPPNNAQMTIVLVPSTSKVAETFVIPGPAA